MCLALLPSVWNGGRIGMGRFIFYMHSRYGWQLFISGFRFFLWEADKIWTLSVRQIFQRCRTNPSDFIFQMVQTNNWLSDSSQLWGRGFWIKNGNVPVTMLNYLCIACTVPSSVFLYNRPKFQSRKYCCKLGKKWEFGVWSHRCWRNRQYLIWSPDTNFNWPSIFYFIFGWQPSRRD